MTVTSLILSILATLTSFCALALAAFTRAVTRYRAVDAAEYRTRSRRPRDDYVGPYPADFEPRRPWDGGPRA